MLDEYILSRQTIFFTLGLQKTEKFEIKHSKGHRSNLFLNFNLSIIIINSDIV